MPTRFENPIQQLFLAKLQYRDRRNALILEPNDQGSSSLLERALLLHRRR